MTGHFDEYGTELVPFSLLFWESGSRQEVNVLLCPSKPQTSSRIWVSLSILRLSIMKSGPQVQTLFSGTSFTGNKGAISVLHLPDSLFYVSQLVRIQIRGEPCIPQLDYIDFSETALQVPQLCKFSLY